MQTQIENLQKQIDALKAQAQAQAQAQTQSASGNIPSARDMQNRIADATGVKMTVGGFIETAGIYRNKNETADVGSSFNTGIPFNSAQNAHQSEFRESARQSRLSLLAEGQVNPDTDVKAYFESDFLGAGASSNSQESNSYTPRLRQAFAQIDRNDFGFHVVGGQTWSLVTMDTQGIIARKEDVPLTIDAQYVPGFNWTRNTELRLVKDFDQKVWLGLSAESPQVANSAGGATTTASPNPATGYNVGGSLLNSTTSYSSDVAPDIVAKVAVDPGWGHYEVFGIGRWFHDNVTTGAGSSTNYHNNTAFALGGGAGMILPVVPKMLDVHATVMLGHGIGRYGSAQLPDVGFNAAGKVEPTKEITALVGVTGHPDPSWDLYLYGGMEKVMRQDYVNGVGFTSTASFASCYQEGGTCGASTASVWQVTPGVWKHVYEGDFGKVLVGLQGSATRRNAFSDVSGGTAPHAIEEIGMASLRYYF
ncbi:MAG TPA: hypothetical protein VK558_08080 [Patescibacteria group bacterium]|nr:hypothetical protein [Patescibacteria group bacterium]